MDEFRLLIDAQAIAEKYDIEVKVFDFDNDSIWGSAVCTKESARIEVNGAISIEDQHYVIAHQMGHLCLGHIKYDVRRADTFETIHRLHWNKEEREANAFADNLLMPRSLVFDAIDLVGLTDLESLATAFGVSKLVMKTRLIRLNII